MLDFLYLQSVVFIFLFFIWRFILCLIFLVSLILYSCKAKQSKAKQSKAINKLSIISLLACAIISGQAAAETLVETMPVPIEFSVKAPSGKYTATFTANPNLVANAEAQDIGTLHVTRVGEANPNEYVCFSSGTGANYITFTRTDDENITMVGDLWGREIPSTGTRHKIDLNSTTDKYNCEDWTQLNYYNERDFVVGGIDSPKVGHFTGMLYLMVYQV